MNNGKHAKILTDLTMKLTEGQDLFFIQAFNHIMMKDFTGLKKTAAKFNDEFNKEFKVYYSEKDKLKRSELNDILETRTMKACKAILRGTEELMSIDDRDYLSVYEKLMILKDEYSNLQSK